MSKREAFLKALRARSSKQPGQFAQARPEQQAALDRLDANVQQAGDWTIGQLERFTQFPPIRALTDLLSLGGTGGSQSGIPPEYQEAQIARGEGWKDYEGWNPWKNMDRQAYEESRYPPLPTTPKLTPPDRAPNVLARTLKDMAIDPTTGLPDVDPIPGGVDLGALVTPSMRMRAGGQLLHPEDLRQLLKKQNTPKYLQNAPNLLLDEAMTLDAMGQGGEAFIAASKFIREAPVADRAKLFGRNAYADNLRNQLARQVDMPVEEITAANQLLQDLPPNWIARRGTSTEIRALKQQDAPLREAATSAAQRMRPFPVTRRAYLGGVGDPETIDILTGDPFEALQEIGWSKEQIDQYLDAATPSGFHALGIPSMDSPEASNVTQRAIYVKERPNIGPEGMPGYQPETLVHEFFHARNKGESLDLMSDYSQSVLGTKLSSADKYPLENLSKWTKRDGKIASAYAREGESLITQKLTALEESLTYDIEDYLSGELAARAFQDLGAGRRTRDLVAWEWMQKNVGNVPANATSEAETFIQRMTKDLEGVKKNPSSALNEVFHSPSDWDVYDRDAIMTDIMKHGDEAAVNELVHEGIDIVEAKRLVKKAKQGPEYKQWVEEMRVHDETQQVEQARRKAFEDKFGSVALWNAPFQQGVVEDLDLIERLKKGGK